MTKEEIISKFKKDRSIKDSYKLSEDEEYFINIIFELQKEVENLEKDSIIKCCDDPANEIDCSVDTIVYIKCKVCGEYIENANITF